MTLSLLKINRLIVLLLAVLIVFKSILIQFKIDILVYLFSSFAILMNANMRVLRPVIPVVLVSPIIFICIGIISMSHVMIQNHYFMGVVGFSGTYLYFIFWLFMLCFHKHYERTLLFQSYIKCLIVIGVLTSVFALYQFFVDPTLFGINPHRMYGDPEMLKTGITRRATSYIGSPQNLGLFMAVLFGFASLTKFKRAFTYLIQLLFVLGGLVSGSAAFAAYLFGFLSGYIISRFRSIISGIAFGLLIIMVTCSFSSQVKIDHAVVNVFKMDIYNHIPYYIPFLSYESLQNLIFGRGLGMCDRLIEVLTNKAPPTIWMPGVESYILKIYYEMGAIGVLGLAILYGKALLNSFRVKTKTGNLLFASLLGLSTNLLGTPSFTGLTMSFLLWPVVIYALCLRNRSLSVGKAK